MKCFANLTSAQRRIKHVRVYWIIIYCDYKNHYSSCPSALLGQAEPIGFFPFGRVQVKRLVLGSNSRHSTECYFSNSSILLHSIPFSILPIGLSRATVLIFLYNHSPYMEHSFDSSSAFYSPHINIYPLPVRTRLRVS